ncbi:cyclohexanone monooxygenase [Moniliophthora roreri]|nr:cyclohexanone monooxygenase [Moniliophthora roreri]
MAENPQEFDVLIVGAGFEGVYTLHQTRNLGFSVKIFESGSDLGGIWFWNRYPDADATTRKEDLECLAKEVIRVAITVEKTKSMTEAERHSESLQGYLGGIKGTMDGILELITNGQVDENQFVTRIQAYRQELQNAMNRFSPDIALDRSLVHFSRLLDSLELLLSGFKLLLVPFQELLVGFQQFLPIRTESAVVDSYPFAAPFPTNQSSGIISRDHGSSKTDDKELVDSKSSTGRGYRSEDTVRILVYCVSEQFDLDAFHVNTVCSQLRVLRITSSIPRVVKSYRLRITKSSRDSTAWVEETKFTGYHWKGVTNSGADGFVGIKVTMTESPQEFDVLIVGAGFGGVYTLHQTRNLGFSVKIFESGSDLGGIWFWNRYPGARVDSHIPLYEFSMPELWKDWTWSERFPSWTELREYFQYMDSKLDLKKDIRFNSRVVSAHFDVTTDQWTVKTADGHEARARFLVLCTGFASKIYIPPIKGLDTFKGIYHHSSQWPEAGLDLRGKRVAVIGTGATGVQIIQEIGPIVEHLTVFQRTPNTCLPMRQAKVDKTMQEKRKSLYLTIFRRRLQTWAGFDYDSFPQNFSSASPEERHLRFEELWERGGFHLVVSNYRDALSNEETNNVVYAFWRDKVRERLNDPEMQEKLAPTVPPHPFAAKRCSLEQNYYEIYNQPNVELVDLQKNAITQITPDGIETSDGVLHQVDVIAFATGFDSITGGIMQIDIRGADGSSIAEKWKNGVHTYLGMTTANFPNMFFTYGPQAPTALSNGPTCTEVQGDWIKECLAYMKANNLSRIEASRAAEVEWRNLALANASLSLLGKAKSWYTGANIPGKPIEQLNLVGGIPFYDAICREKAAKRYEGFAFSSDKSIGSGQESKESKEVNGFATANAA